ncbi:hypothetical protein D3H65_12270 [Paraflavitalea soli]|uniref:DUF3078 domain-containing protein n=1 Tax=Paraflavitalea soli TaxID=2315862 RepID=A0A3B7MWE8_9BACT|nr:hypothetical protein [Paraflavitalea soli]AXY74711.1 hypothetical protein D3H65_12270 [Paraflavitalea soli]
MGKPYPYIPSYAVTVVLVLLMATASASAQLPNAARDTAQPAKKGLHKLPDSLRSVTDTTVKNVRWLAQYRQEQWKNKLTSKGAALKGMLPGKKNFLPQDSLKFDFNNPFKKLLLTKPLLKVNGGYISYQFNYRSAIDTPYVEKDIAQHNITGNLFLTVAGHLPVRLTWWSRQSNSRVFRDITDVQASFDAPAFQQQLQNSLRQRLLAMAPNLRDSLTEKLYGLKKLQLDDLRQSLQTTFSPQSLVEANETLRVPRITWSPGLPDSVNSRREDSLKKAAGFFLDLYAKTKGEYDRLSNQVDSLKAVYQQNEAKVRQFKQMVTGKWDDLVASRNWTEKLQEYGMNKVEVPAKYKWLMGLRQFSVGRSVTNYSELTVKNTSVNGINFEYNSWYYLAVSAGLVDYRYRDFVVNGSNKKPQYLYLVRAGIGRLEKNYFILSAFRGEKQLFPSNASRLSSITVTGFSAEARMQVNPTTHITAEVAKSLAPDFRNNPSLGNTKFTLSDHSNQAYAIKVYSFIPATATRLEGFYKHTGANFQSFSSFQTNNALESWTLKADQGFFKRKLRLAASLRKNEFTNPFLPQDYKSNTVFKSLTATFKMRKWPVITVGYQPMSQLTALDSQVIENRFQVLNASMYHIYKINNLRTASTVVLNRFYNSNSDTGFVYFNATNVFWAQQFFFKAFTTQVAVSYTRNPGYRMVVMDEGIQLNLKQLGSVGLGVKINSLNDDLVKTGGYVNANLRVYKQDFITLSYESGYLPGFNKALIKNEMATVQFVKSF